MKYAKYALYALAVLAFAFSQYLILSNMDFVRGGIFIAASVFITLIAYFEKFIFFKHAGKLFSFIAVIVLRLVKKIEKNEAPAEASEPEKMKNPAAEKRTPETDADESIENLRVTSAETAPKTDFKTEVLKKDIAVNKNVLAALLIILFVAIQALFFSGRTGWALFAVILAVLIGGWYISVKGSHIRINISYNYGKTIGIVAGAGMILLAWMLFMYHRQIRLPAWTGVNYFSTQHIGFWLNIIGPIILVLFIPSKSRVEHDLETEYNDADLRYGWITNYWIKAVFLLVSIAVFFAAGWLFSRQEHEVFMLALYVISFILFMLSLPLFNAEKIRLKDNAIDFILRFLALAAAFYLAYRGQKLFYINKVADAMYSFIAAAMLLIFFFPPGIVFKEQSVKEKLDPRTEAFILIAITLFGLYLRVHDINGLPVGIENDEAGGLITVFEKWDNRMQFMIGRYAIYLYMMEPFIKFMGVSHLSLKLIGICVGTLTIPAVYFTVRYLFNTASAIIVTLMFAVARWHLHFSRSGHGTIMLPLTVAVCIYFIIRGLKQRDKWDFFWGGIAGGLCWHGYRSGQLMVFGLVVFLVYKLISERYFVKRFWIGLIAFSVGFWMFSAPLFQLWFTARPLMIGRSNDVSVFSKDPNAPRNPALGIYDNAKKVFLMFNHRGDMRQRNTGMMPGDKEIDFTSGIFFMLGLLYSLYYWRDNRFLLFILSFITITAASILSIEAPSGFRTFGAATVVFFYVAIPIYIAAKFFQDRLNKRAAFILILLLSVPVLFYTVKENYEFYFKRNVGGMDEVSTRSGEFIGKYGREYVSVLLGSSLGYTGHPPFRIWTWKYNTGNTSNFIDCFPERRLKDTDKGFIYLVSPSYLVMLDYIRGFYKGERIKDFHPAYGHWFDAYVIPAKEILGLRGVQARYIKKGFSEIKRDENLIRFPKDITAPYKAVWDGALYISRYGETTLGVETDCTSFNVFLDGKKVLRPGKTEYASYIPKGLHNIKITAQKDYASEYFKLTYQTRNLVNKRRSYIVIPKSEIKHEDLYKIKKVNGLTGTYYSTVSFKTAVQLKQVDPFIHFDNTIAAAPYAVKWAGFIRIPETGIYSFILSTNGSFAEVSIDNKIVWQRGNDPDTQKSMATKDVIQLTKGIHEISARAGAPGFVTLKWKKPGSTEEIVPADVLFPVLK